MSFDHHEPDKSSSPNALVGHPVTSCIKATPLGPRLRGEDGVLRKILN